MFIDNHTVKYLELFAGIGGFRSAIERIAKKSNIFTKCVGFSEIDPYAIKTYKANFKTADSDLEIGDITSLNTNKKISQLPSFDVLFAGFPCQPFSLMGKRGGFEDSRGTLFFHIANILSIKKPEFFILENVRGLKTHHGGKTLERILEILRDELGYSVRAEVLNSLDFGVPQVRRRLYLIGVKNKKTFKHISDIDFKNTKRRSKYKTTWDILEQKVDDKYYLSEKIIKTILAHGSGKYWSKSEIDKTLARPLTASMHKMHRANQDNYYSDNFINGKLVNGKLIPIESNKKRRIRRLTPLEAFRLQSFDDSFVVKAQQAGVSDTQLYRQAGNAITVNVAEDILRSLFKAAS